MPAVRFCLAIYAFVALLFTATYELHVALGGRGMSQNYIRAEFLFILVWMPFIPLIVTLARRIPLVMHLPVVLVLSAATLAMHKLTWCPSLECMTDYTPGPWAARWLALDAFFYAAIVISVRIIDAQERSHRDERQAEELERHVASAELQLVHARIDPQQLIDLFDQIAAQVAASPARAEIMISRLADELRKEVAVLGTTQWSIDR